MPAQVHPDRFSASGIYIWRFHDSCGQTVRLLLSIDSSTSLFLKVTFDVNDVIVQ